MSEAPLLQVKDLSVAYPIRRGLFARRDELSVIDGITLELNEGETLGVVGESGCGKTTLANSLLKLTRISCGSIHFAGINVLAARGEALRQIRRDVQVVFQNPFSSLNPRLSVMNLIAEPLRTHLDLRRDALRKRVRELLREVGLSDDYLDRYPHELSGGQAQRVVIARALALKPRLVILDEPTAALDVSVQAQIINLLMRLQHSHNLAYLFISHDLSVVRHVSERIAVMYLGRVVELGDAKQVFDQPSHPYTEALLAATPSLQSDAARDLQRLQGELPSISNPPKGCRFHTRCPHAFERCHQDEPHPTPVGTGWAACHLVEPRQT